MWQRQDLLELKDFPHAPPKRARMGQAGVGEGEGRLVLATWFGIWGSVLLQLETEAGPPAYRVISPSGEQDIHSSLDNLGAVA